MTLHNPGYCQQGHRLSEVGRHCDGQCAICRSEKKRNDQNLTLYGKTTAEILAMLAAQGGRCKLCGRDDCHWGKGFQNVWHVDHVHGTKIVRGILCAACNMLVGQIEKNLTLSLEAIKYLSGWGG
jgi:Recombination endonuclease VII